MKHLSRNQHDNAESFDTLTARLVETVLGWRTCPDRFITSGRAWIPRWRFRPFDQFADALHLLGRVRGNFQLIRDGSGSFTAKVQIDDRHHGEASGEFEAQTVTVAIVRALGFEVGGC